MLHSTMEVITQATSNSLFVFLFCNLIIVILLVSSVKPGSGLDEDSSTPLPVVANKKKKNGKYIIVEHSFEESKDLITVSEVSNAQIASIDDANNNVYDNNRCNTIRNNNNNNDNIGNNNSSGKNTTTTSGNNNNNSIGNNNNNNDGDNDELRRKVEEFIEKVNRGWRAENLRTHSLVHIEKNPQPELTRIRAN